MSSCCSFPLIKNLMDRQNSGPELEKDLNEIMTIFYRMARPRGSFTNKKMIAIAPATITKMPQRLSQAPPNQNNEHLALNHCKMRQGFSADIFYGRARCSPVLGGINSSRTYKKHIGSLDLKKGLHPGAIETRNVLVEERGSDVRNVADRSFRARRALVLRTF